MSASKGYAGRGSKLEVTQDGGSTYTKVLQIRKFAYGGVKSETDDISNIDSPSAYVEIMPTMINAGDVKGDGVLNPTDPSVILLKTLQDAQTLVGWRITYLDGTVDTFQGYVTEWTPAEVDTKKAVGYAFTIGITGPVTRTPATTSTPTISSLNPTTAVHATTVPIQINGTNFFNSQGTGGVTIGGTAATVLSWSDTVVIVSLPASLGAGSKNVVVTNAAGNASAPTALTLS